TKVGRRSTVRATSFVAGVFDLIRARPTARECAHILPHWRESRHEQRFSTSVWLRIFSPARNSVSPSRTIPRRTCEDQLKLTTLPISTRALACLTSCHPPVSNRNFSLIAISGMRRKDCLLNGWHAN